MTAPMKIKITLLGCGSSPGVPLINGDWGNCNPDNPKNRRYRSTIHMEINGFGILVDASPDIRNQVLDNGIKRVDTVLFTHSHADHIFGLHELRPFLFTQHHPIPIYADEPTLVILKKAFDFAFEAKSELYPRFIEANTFGPEKFEVFGIPIQPFAQDHGMITSWGFRVGNFAYSTDFKSIPESSLSLLEGLDLWIVDCLRFEEHPTHACFHETMAIIERVKPKRAIFTHMNQHMDYDVALAACPPNVEPGYDGMVFEL